MGKYDTGQIYLYAGRHHTRRHRAPYITSDNETKLRVTVSPLDLSDPKPPGGVPAFIEPVPWGEMNASLERSRPWEPWGGLDPQSFTFTDQWGRWHEADGMYIQLNKMVEAFLGDKTPCPFFNNGDLVCIYRSRYQWCINTWTRPGGDLMPHLNAFIIDPEPMLPDRLTTGEICTAFSMIAKSRLEDGYNSCRYIPLIIFSVSNRDLRILQCWHDKDNPRNLQIRKSPIMNFKEGMKKNWKDWVTVICWIAAKPLGDTMNESEIGR